MIPRVVRVAESQAEWRLLKQRSNSSGRSIARLPRKPYVFRWFVNVGDSRRCYLSPDGLTMLIVMK